LYRWRRSVWSSLSWRRASFIERCSAEAPIKGASQAVHDLFGERLVSVNVFRREHDDARSEAMAKRVHAGTSLPSGVRPEAGARPEGVGGDEACWPRVFPGASTFRGQGPEPGCSEPECPETGARPIH
jgi:hypothetical protein